MKVFIGDEIRNMMIGTVPRGLRINGKRPHRIEISTYELMDNDYKFNQNEYLKVLSTCMQPPVVAERHDMMDTMILKTVEETS